ncbi:MAG TPA: putative Ig domain-containing protein [Verrucomicrobiae bacterium]|jgi:alpha-galactosidase|nr:putative Ig domain-containing protein [Verrucomicrobiae bacterium]
MKTSLLHPRTSALFYAAALAIAPGAYAQDHAPAPEIRTPRAPLIPHINGPDIFGVRPGNPFLYHIPATGDRPMTFSADELPRDLKLNAATGDISGSLPGAGEFNVTFHAKNSKGAADKKFKIVVGEEISLTPPMGWNSWNAYHATVTGENVMHAAHAMAASGLINHGWSYINIDDSWQGKRGRKFNGIQPNEKFPDMQKMCNDIHAMGLKVGIYSTPWVTSYAGYVGGSADNSEGTWEKPTDHGRLNGKFPFADNDADQWAAWGIDYLKYDWNPRNSSPKETPEDFHQHSATMTKALRKSKRDVVFSYSNSMPFEDIADQSLMYNCWRTTGDIGDSWLSMGAKAFYMNAPKGSKELEGAPSDRWAPFARPGHWNDPDMMVLGYVNFGGKQHPTRLTPDEQYLHMTAWCMAAAPLLLGCDLDKLDDFTLNLVSNDEVLGINQDRLGKQATLASNEGNTLLVYMRPLEDGSEAVALYNLGKEPVKVTAKWPDLKLMGKHNVRDLWRQKDLGDFSDEFSMNVGPHGAELVKIK